MVEKQGKYQIFICSDQKSSRQAAIGLCTRFFQTKDEVPNFTIIDTKEGDEATASKKIEEAFEKVVKDKKSFLLIQTNRFRKGTEGKVNSFGNLVSKIFQGQRINASRILVFDGQQYYQHPYNLTQQSWIKFNQVFYNYWYANKSQKLNMRTQKFGDKLQGMTVNYVGAFFSYNISRFTYRINKFDVFLSSEDLKQFIKPKNMNLLSEILEQYLLKSQIGKIQIFDADKFDSSHMKLIKNSVLEAFSNPYNNIVFIDDTIDFKLQQKEKGIQQKSKLIITHQEDPRNKWQDFLIAPLDSPNPDFQGFSTGLINPKYAHIEKVFKNELHDLKNFCYVEGFNAGDLLHILHLRYAAIYLRQKDKFSLKPNKPIK